MNSFPSSKIIKKEYEKLNMKPSANLGLTVGLFEEDNNNIYRWKVTYLAPRDSSYENGIFHLEVIFPKLYPEEAPKIIFKTPIYHPNVYKRKSYNDLELGEVAFKDIIYWKHTYNMNEVLTKLYTIFYYPNLDLVYSLSIAKEYKKEKYLFEKKAQYFTKKYADPSKKEIKYEYWDFSCDENDLNSIKIKPFGDIILNKNYDGNQSITLFLEINGIIVTKINCKLNELIEDVIKKVLNQNGISENSNILVINSAKKIKLNVPIGGYKFTNHTRITIILNE